MDKREWHIYARLVCEHQEAGQCGRPQWVRVLVLWHQSFVDKLENSRVWKAAYWLFPALFGGKALMCANCQTVAFQSRGAEVGRKVIGCLTGFVEGDPEVVLLLNDDAGHLPEQTVKRLNVEGG